MSKIKLRIWHCCFRSFIVCSLSHISTRATNVPSNRRCYTPIMKLLLAAMFMAAFSYFDSKGILTDHIPVKINTISKFTFTTRIQDPTSKPASASQSPQQARAAVGSPTRVWRYVIIGSAIIILALVGVIALYRLKRYIEARNTAGR